MSLPPFSRKGNTKMDELRKDTSFIGTLQPQTHEGGILNVFIT
jgi:hypothetical protein